VAVNLLLSYAFHDGTDLGKIRKNLVCGQLMIDSGAFTAHSKGRQISLDAYADYLQRWAGCWDHAITLDVIGDPAATRANTRKLHAKGIPVMPVFTRGNTLADFDAMVKDSGYVCVGGLIGYPQTAIVQRIGMLQRRAQSAGGGIHALGVGSVTNIRKARPYSSDASSISASFQWGRIAYFNGRDVIGTRVTDRKTLARDREHIRAHGINLAQLARTARLPNQSNGRQELMQAMSLAFACADEYLRRQPVPAPHRWPSGPHLYSSLGRTADAVWSAQVDARLHDGPHLYSSLGKDRVDADVASRIDRRLHDGPNLYVSPAQPDAEGAAAADAALHGQRPDGPHLYSSVTTDYAPDAAAAAAAIHTGWCPPVWARYASGHVCYRRKAEVSA
jgi:hypothetical protein